MRPSPKKPGCARKVIRYQGRGASLPTAPRQAVPVTVTPAWPGPFAPPRDTPMVRMTTIVVAVIVSAAIAQAQNYPPFLREAEQALANEFRELERQDWQQWRPQQEWRVRQADDEDDATCWRLQDRYSSYSDCRARLLAIRQECARGIGEFFDSDCD
jgi:hypothetical protein